MKTMSNQPLFFHLFHLLSTHARLALLSPTDVEFSPPNSEPKALDKAIRLDLVFMKPIPSTLTQCTLSGGLIRFVVLLKKTLITSCDFLFDHF